VTDRLAPYLALVSARYRMLLQYRAAALAGFATQLFWGAIKLMVLAAFYRQATGSAPMNFAELACYVWLGQALLGLLPWNVDPELQDKISSGAVAYELLRPIDLYAAWFARTLALRCATTSLRALPMVFVCALVLPVVGLDEWALRPPASLASGAAFLLSMLATIGLAAAITMVLHAGLIHVISAKGFTSMMASVVVVLSGMLVPLPLFPDWLQPVLYWQPFRGLADVPYRIYVGHIAPDHALLEIAMQLGWTALIVVVGRILLDRASARLVIQGG
jgi:ABC-2 type transport system permease protein